MSGPWRLLRALRLRLLGPEKQYVGSDQFGNKYYVIPKHQSRAGQTIPERRFVEAAKQKPHEYEQGDLPTEWEAWIRKRRKDPPMVEEILKNQIYREQIKLKIKDASEKDSLLQSKEYTDGGVAEPVQTEIKGHASAPFYGKNEPSPDPSSTAKTFQPGAWIPESRNK
ncbi:NADH dehydrogenase [ubiquinone] 1 alpha subcomplex assembly factor 2 isoform X1 [Carettochelys insculpta]|uniref:NADH dehydrogenase [ubiquinone] 1 alpha subcomplex assembly factor 2 isoform X1 n=1 Tax=Carettochelys insculpta TaxID=44489 RepID=UPI003EBA2EBA